MDDVKSGVWGRKRGEWGSGMPLNLSTLTVKTREGPAVNISIDPRPNKAGGDELL